MEKRIHSIHSLESKRQIYKEALKMRSQGKLYDLQDRKYEDTFNGNIDRFCEIAFRLRKSRRILDVGAGNGLLLSLLSELGHECHAVDINDLDEIYSNKIFKNKSIVFKQCNVEVDEIPYSDNFFDAVVCCQTLEHFTHSHLKAMKEIFRIIKIGGCVEVDVPNAVCFRNRSRILRGKQITWDYKKHYMYEEPILYKGYSFFPGRHNREFTRDELKLLLEESNFRNIEVYFLQSRRHREGVEKAMSIGTILRDSIPSFRKTLIAFGGKI